MTLVNLLCGKDMGKFRWNPTEVSFFHGPQPVPRRKARHLLRAYERRMDLGGWPLGAAVIVLAREGESRLAWTFHQVAESGKGPTAILWPRAPKKIAGFG